MLENLDKIMHLHFNFDACPMHSPFGFVHLTHQNLSARALFCLNSLAKVHTQLLIYNYEMLFCAYLHFDICLNFILVNYFHLFGLTLQVNVLISYILAWIHSTEGKLHFDCS